MRTQSVVIVRSSYSTYGGVERVALDVIGALLQNQIRVQLLTWDARKWPISHPKLEVIPVGVRKGPRFLQAFAFNQGVTRFVDAHRPPCVFSFDKVTVFSHLHGGGGTHRTYLRIKNADSNLISRSFRRLSLFHAYILELERKGFSHPQLQKVQCASLLVKHDIISDYGVPEEKLKVIPNGIDWNAMGSVFDQPQKTITDLATRHRLDPTRRHLLFLGSGFERKGLDIAMRGLAGLPEGYDLLVVGKGRTEPYQRLARKLSIDHRVCFLGPQEDGWKYCALCKALVLPSRYEPFGIAPAEANAMGIPVLISNRTGYLDWIEEGRNGVILGLNDSPEASDEAFVRLRQIIESPRMTAAQIRQAAYGLDRAAVMHQLLHEFLQIQASPSFDPR